jgi:selenocysteine lyase/cysteine desulfurase
MVGQIGLGASLEMLLKFQPVRMSERILQMTEHACDRLRSVGATIKSPRDGNHRSGIVAFEMPGQDSLALKRKCLSAGVVMSCRGGLLRISPHAYVNEQDIDRLVEAVKN